MNIFKYINLDTGKTIARVYVKEITSSHEVWNEEGKRYVYAAGEDQYTVKLIGYKGVSTFYDCDKVEGFIRVNTKATSVKRKAVFWSVYEPAAYILTGMAAFGVLFIAAAIIG